MLPAQRCFILVHPFVSLQLHVLNIRDSRITFFHVSPRKFFEISFQAIQHFSEQTLSLCVVSSLHVTQYVCPETTDTQLLTTGVG